MILVKLYSFTWLYWQYFQVKFIKSDKSYIWEIIPLNSVYTVQYILGVVGRNKGGGKWEEWQDPTLCQNSSSIHFIFICLLLQSLCPPPPSPPSTPLFYGFYFGICSHT